MLIYKIKFFKSSHFIKTNIIEEFNRDSEILLEYISTITN